MEETKLTPKNVLYSFIKNIPSLVMLKAFAAYILIVTEHHRTAYPNNPWALVAFVFIGIYGLRFSYHYGNVLDSLSGLALLVVQYIEERQIEA